MVVSETSDSTIDFEKFHSALREMNLLNSRGFVVRVSGLTVESSGPTVGLGELCGIQIRDGRRVLAEVSSRGKRHQSASGHEAFANEVTTLKLGFFHRWREGAGRIPVRPEMVGYFMALRMRHV